jgi:alpha-L-rhamnosidase
MAYMGFRYARVEGIDPRQITVKAYARHSNIQLTGSFKCSDERVNRLQENILWSSRSNFVDIPTDCPTRERHGWTGDAQLFFTSAAYLFNFAPFARKYLHDVYDWQKKNGRLPHIAPEGGSDFYMWTMNGSVGWSDVGILLPYRFWKKYGDREILTQYYDRMKKYAAFMIRRVSPDGVVRRGQSYGEWAEPADVKPNDWKDMVLPHPEVSTAYTAYVLRCLAEIAEELHRPEDAAKYRAVSEKCKAAYQKAFGKDLDTDRQAQLVRPLAFALLSDEQTAFAEKRLITALEHYGWRLSTGFLSTPLILDVLAEIDIEAAYRLLENEEMPGWLFMPKAGATTVWESWEGTEAQGGIASLNHYSKGAAVEWLFKTMCGIRVDGENHLTFAPRPGGNLTVARAAYDSVYGTVESGLTKENGKTVYTFTIPANCSASVTIAGRDYELVSGTYTLP